MLHGLQHIHNINTFSFRTTYDPAATKGSAQAVQCYKHNQQFTPPVDRFCYASTRQEWLIGNEILQWKTKGALRKVVKCINTVL